MTITEEYFKEKFLNDFRFKSYSDEEYLTEQLNGEKICYACEEFQEFFYHFLKDHDLPWEVCATFPWLKYFKDGLLLGIEQIIRRLLRRKYDRDFFEPEEPFYYVTLKDHLFNALARINGDDHYPLKTDISEQCFRENFLEEFPKFRSKKNDRLATLALNAFAEEDCQVFFYRFLLENDLPMKIYFNFPWRKHFKRGLIYGLRERIKKWRGMEYDRDFFKPEEPLYYDTLKNHLFNSLEQMNNKNS